MQDFICCACGTQYPPAEAPPDSCPVCVDDRQYIRKGGQNWISSENLARNHLNSFRLYEPGLWGIGSSPTFAIGQRALLVQTSQGNILWDCISLLDDATKAIVQALGGISAIAISHPHYYTTMVDWSRAFGDVPIYIHEADSRWIARREPTVQTWGGENKRLNDEFTIIRCGGHTAGACVAHWSGGASGRGTLLTGDTIQVAIDRRWVGFMWSYPNWVPVNSAAVHRITAALDPFGYESLYGAFWDYVIPKSAEAVVKRSADRYLAALVDDPLP